MDILRKLLKRIFGKMPKASEFPFEVSDWKIIEKTEYSTTYGRTATPVISRSE